MGEELITGVIPTKDHPVIFTVKKDDFGFSFLTDFIYHSGEKCDVTKIDVSQDGFVEGYMHDGKDIAIYIGHGPYELVTSGTVYTSAYILSSSESKKENLEFFDAICFQGGTLNNLFDIDGISFIPSKDTFVVNRNDDKKTYTVSAKEYDFEIEISSEVSTKNSRQRKEINNSDVIMTLKFKKPQTRHSFFEHYNNILKMLSFLTFRENVGFDKIFLEKYDDRIGSTVSSAEVFIRKDQELTNKSYYNNITFEDLGDKLTKLLNIIYNTEESKQSFLLGFIPSNDEDLNKMSNMKIREVCSALECELVFVDDIKTDETNELNELVSSTKDFVKEFRKKHNKLTNDTYNLIFSSIGNWSFPLAEKLCALYRKYEQELLNLNRSTVNINEEAIRAVVKYRNDITHGKHRILDLRTAVTAFYLGGLVYLCFLERLGVDRETIDCWCKDKLLR